MFQRRSSLGGHQILSPAPTLNLEAGYKLPRKFCHVIHIANHMTKCHTPSHDKDSEMELKACVSFK